MGDPEIIDTLDAAVRSELPAVSRLWLHHRMREDRMREDRDPGRLTRKRRAERIAQLHPADRAIARIILLDGLPHAQKPDPLQIGQTIRDKGDSVSTPLCEGPLNDEEGHLEYPDARLGLFGNPGAERRDPAGALPAVGAE
jgi:bacterioferritin